MVVAGESQPEIGPGLLVLLGMAEEDDEAAAELLAGRVARLRIFENEEGKLDRSRCRRVCSERECRSSS